MSSSARPVDAAVGLFEAKTHLSELVCRAEAGETITITKHGRPVARLVPARNRSTAQDVQRASERVRAILAESGFATTHGDIDELKRIGRS